MRIILDIINQKIAKEVALYGVLKVLTFKRIVNALKITSSFLFSAIFKKNVVWGVPVILNVEPTNICNLRCPLCITGSLQMKRPYGRMDFEMFKNAIDKVADKLIYITLYHQGEPYLNPQFNDFVRYAKVKGIYVTTSSNAHFFDEAGAEAVVNSGLDSMIISLDGVTQESYQHYRRGGNLDKVLSGIENLVKAKEKMGKKTPYLLLQFLVMKHNEDEIEQVKELAEKIKVDRLLIKTTQVMTKEEAIEWLPKNEKYRRYDFGENGLSVKQGKGVCPRPWLTSLVDWDGQVVPCCFDKNGDYAMGDFREEKDFNIIWHSKKYNGFRKTMLKNRNAIDICKNCNYGIGLFK
jgi:radical SAM protein with 4Fe4S-binding SPASM domain